MSVKTLQVSAMGSDYTYSVDMADTQVAYITPTTTEVSIASGRIKEDVTPGTGLWSYYINGAGYYLGSSPWQSLDSNWTPYVNYGTYATLTWSTIPVSASDLFSDANPTTRTVLCNIRSAGYTTRIKCKMYNYDDEERFTVKNSVSLTTLQLTLDAPPSFSETLTYTNAFNGEPYANLTTANVTLSNLSAEYGGDFSDVGSATFTIGSRTVTKANPADNDVLSIALNSVGTFTPTISVTDSRGQTTTHSLADITVLGYTAPAVSFNVERALSSPIGKPDDDGVYAVISPTFTFTDAIAKLRAPTVAVVDDGGNAEQVSTTWYSVRASDGTLSGSVTWVNLSSGDTVYGLVSITGDFNTQKSYQIAVTPTDSEGTGTTKTQTLGNAFYTIDFLAGGHGIAFGKPATREGFDCDMNPFFMTWVGIVQQFAGTTAPPGWLICNGDTVSRTHYSALFDVIGTTYGAGDGSTTFKLPDLQGRVIVGVSGSYTLASTGGSADAIIPYHRHSVSSASAGSHTHGQKTLTGRIWFRKHGSSLGGNAGAVDGICSAGADYTTQFTGATSNTTVSSYKPNTVSINATHTHDSVTVTMPAHNTDYEGTDGNTVGANMQPYVVMNYIIYAGVLPPTS